MATLGMLAVSVRLALLAISDSVERGEVAVYYVAFFFLATAWRAMKSWRIPLVPFGAGTGWVCLGLYCVGLALLIGLKLEGAAPARLPSALFMGAASVCYFGLAVLVLWGRLQVRVASAPH